MHGSYIVDPRDLVVPYLTDRPVEEALAGSAPASLFISRYLGPSRVGSALSLTDAVAAFLRYVTMLECGRHDELRESHRNTALWRDEMLSNAGEEKLVDMFVAHDAAEGSAWSWIVDVRLWTPYNEPSEYPILYAARVLVTRAVGPASSDGSPSRRKFLLSSGLFAESRYTNVLARIADSMNERKDIVVLPSLSLFQPFDPSAKVLLYPAVALPWTVERIITQEAGRVIQQTHPDGSVERNTYATRLEQQLVWREEPNDFKLLLSSSEGANAGLLWFNATVEFRSPLALWSQTSDFLQAGMPKLSDFPEVLNETLSDLRRQLGAAPARIILNASKSALVPVSYDPILGELTWLLTKDDGTQQSAKTNVVDRGGGGDCFYKSVYSGLLDAIGNPDALVGRDVDIEWVRQIRRSVLDYIAQNYPRIEYLRLSEPPSSDAARLGDARQSVTKIGEFTAALVRDACFLLNKDFRWAEEAAVYLTAEALRVEIFNVTLYGSNLSYDRVLPTQKPLNTLFVFNINESHYQLIERSVLARLLA